MQEIQKLISKWGLRERCLLIGQDDITLHTPGKSIHNTSPSRRGFYFLIGTSNGKKIEAQIKIAQQTIYDTCPGCPFYDKICHPQPAAVRIENNWRPAVMPQYNGQQDVRKYNLDLF